MNEVCLSESCTIFVLQKQTHLLPFRRMDCLVQTLGFPGHHTLVLLDETRPLGIVCESLREVWTSLGIKSVL